MTIGCLDWSNYAQNTFPLATTSSSLSIAAVASILNWMRLQFSQHGGILLPETGLMLTHPDNGVEVYYTLDGSDPRNPSGGFSAAAQRYGGVPLSLDGPQSVAARAWNGSEWSAKIQADFFIALPGDVNQDQTVDALDIDAMCRQIGSGEFDVAFDLNRDQLVNQADSQWLIEQILGTTAGDANLDGVFNSADLITAFGAGLYEDAVPGNATWSSGDWTCDGDFDSADLVAAFQSGAYVAGATRALKQGPWPSALAAALAPPAAIDTDPGPRHGRSFGVTPLTVPKDPVALPIQAVDAVYRNAEPRRHRVRKGDLGKPADHRQSPRITNATMGRRSELP